MDRFGSFMQGNILGQSLDCKHRKRMILLDDVPDLTSSVVKDRFYEIMDRCVRGPQPFLMVIVMSDATSNSVSSTYNSVETRITQAHDILPDSLIESPYVRNIT
jgi:hypothetical protein